MRAFTLAGVDVGIEPVSGAVDERPFRGHLFHAMPIAIEHSGGDRDALVLLGAKLRAMADAVDAIVIGSPRSGGST